MRRLRSACLVATALYAGVHLILWISVLPTMLRPSGPMVQEGSSALVLFIAFYTVLGVVGVWWPLAALAHPGRRIEAIRCALLAALYAVLFLAAWLPGPGAPPATSPWQYAMAEAGAGLLAAGFVFVLLSFGLIEDPILPALAYAAALLLGAALTLRRGPISPAAAAPR